MPARRTAVANAALAIRGATVVTMDPLRTVGIFDVLIDTEGRIADLADLAQSVPAQSTLDAAGLVVVPGLVQVHLHLCQTLFRGLAEVLPLLTWLRERIWPL